MSGQVITLAGPDRLREAMAVNEAIHGNPTSVWEDFLFHHPRWGSEGTHRAVIVDGRVVSLTSLAIWRQRFGTSTLPTGEIGLVGTLPEHRNRGYSRALMESWLDSMRRERIPMSFLIGIPDFYERWNYHYAAPDYVSSLLSIAAEPLARCAGTSGAVRDADPDRDTPVIVALLDREARQTPASPVMEEDLVRHFIGRSDVHGVSWRVVEDAAGEVTGVVRTKRWGEGIGPQAPGAVTLVAARDDRARAAIASDLLDHLRRGNQTELSMCIAPHGPFGRWLYERGAKRKSDRSIYPGGYAAMYRVNDLPAVLGALKLLWPVEELVSRLGGTAITLRAGRDAEQVATIAITDGGVEIRPGEGGVEVGAPPAVVVPWVTGWRSAGDWLDGTSYPPLPGPAVNSGDPGGLPAAVQELLRMLFPARHPYIGDTIQNA